MPGAAGAVGRGHEVTSSATDVDPRVVRLLPVVLLATTAVVLTSHVVLVGGLVASGVSWTDGSAAYGVAGLDPSAPAPGPLVAALGTVAVLSVLLGPWVVVPGGVVAGLSLPAARRRGARADVVVATATLALAVGLAVLLATWGDELWVWLLD